MLGLANLMIAQFPMQVRLQSVSLQHVSSTLQGTTVNHDNGSAFRRGLLGRTHERTDITPETNDARHFGLRRPIHPDGEVICQLGCTGATGAGVDQR